MSRKDSPKLIAVLALILYLLGLIFSAAMSEAFIYVPIDDMFMTLPLVLGVSFLFSDKKATKMAGYGLLALMSTVFLVDFISNDFASETLEIDYYSLTTAIILIVAIIFQIVISALIYFGFERVDLQTNRTKVSRVSLLKKWQLLVANGKVSEENYNKLKNKVLAESFSQEDYDNFNELKELVENNLINQEDIDTFLS